MRIGVLFSTRSYLSNRNRGECRAGGSLLAYPHADISIPSHPPFCTPLDPDVAQTKRGTNPSLPLSRRLRCSTGILPPLGRPHTYPHRGADSISRARHAMSRPALALAIVATTTNHGARETSTGRTALDIRRVWSYHGLLVWGELPCRWHASRTPSVPSFIHHVRGERVLRLDAAGQGGGESPG